jgi:C4-dicarboxylate transporter DctM subunit
MEYWILIAGILIFLVTFVGGTPIWLSLTLSAIFLGLFYAGMSPQGIPSTFLSSLDSFLLLAVPFFLLGGNIMARCGPAKYLFEAIDAFVGHIPGGLPFATVVTCMVFAAITGSTLATLVSVGTIAVPPMVALGYPKRFCLGLMCVSGTLGQLIPPSIYMILYGAYVQESAAMLFAGGMIPGIILGLLIGLIAMIMTKRGKWGAKREILSWSQRWRRFGKGLPAMIMPFIVLGGIYTGLFTPTEAAAVACIYAVLVSYFFYRGLNRETLSAAVRAALGTTSMIFLIVAAAVLFAGPFTYAQIPQNITKGMINLGFGKTGFMLVSIGLFLVLGLFLDPLPILYLTIPILYYPIMHLGIDLIHFCVITIICMQIAQVTPPFGVSLYATSQLWDEPIQNVIKSALPFLIMTILTLPLFLFVPWFSVWLPILLGH